MTYEYNYINSGVLMEAQKVYTCPNRTLNIICYINTYNITLRYNMYTER